MVINTADKKYQTSTETSQDSKPDAILSGIADHKSGTYDGEQDDLKNNEFLDQGKAFIVSDMPETFNQDVKLDREGRLYKHVNGKWHVYDMMDATPITDDAGNALTFDGVSGSAEYPAFSNISAGAATSHRLMLTKNKSNVYEINAIKYGTTERVDAFGNKSTYGVYAADVDYIVNSAFSQDGMLEPCDADGLFYHKAGNMPPVDWRYILFSYKPVYYVRLYAAADVSQIKYVKLSTVKLGSVLEINPIAAISHTSNDKLFIIRNIDEANDRSGSDITIFSVRGTATSPDQLIMEVW